MRGSLLVLLPIVLCVSVFGKDPDWPATEAHAIDLLQRYVRIASVNPPADTTESARFLAGRTRCERDRG